MAVQDVPLNSSSNVNAAQYDPETQDLFIQFGHGGGGVFRNVPANEVERFSQSGSPGAFVTHVLKPLYPYERLA